MEFGAHHVPMLPIAIITTHNVMRRALNGANGSDPVYAERKPRRRVRRRGTS
jgi:hypothetical protein